MNSDKCHFDLTASNRIEKFAEAVLTKSELERVNSLSRDLLSTEDKRKPAIQFLQNIFGMQPKRPLYYLSQDIQGLPEKTRYVVENAGHFIDVLVKHCTHEFGKFHALAMHASLGSNIKRLEKLFPGKFLQNLDLFNGLFYTPAKHKWDIDDRPHLFSIKETIICLFVARHLAGKITNTSVEARTWVTNS